MAKFIRDWNDLVGLESEHYKLKIDTEMGYRQKYCDSNLSVDIPRLEPKRE